MVRIRNAFLAGSALTIGLPLFAGFGSTETFLPAVGRVPGQGGAQFYTTVWATNLTTAQQSFTFQLLKQGQANGSPASFADSLAPGETKVYENVVESKLGLTNAIGAGRIMSSGEIFVSERIYNQAPGDDVGNTEGLFFAGVPKGFSISAGQSASIQGINQGGTENFRYNFALIETGGGSPTVNVQVFDGSGALLGQKAYILQPYEQIQPNVADVVAGIATTNARITATVTGGTGSALLAGAQLANESQDSSGFEMTFRDDILGSGGGSGVTSLNGLTGDVTLAGGTNVTLGKSGNTITINASSSGGAGGLTLPFSGSANTSDPVFSVTNSGPGNGVLGQTTSGIGVSGRSSSDPGVVGMSVSSTGVYGTNGESGITGLAGVWGDSHDSTGVQGTSLNVSGVLGISKSSYGVQGASTQNAGVYGTSNLFDGVHGDVDNGSAGVAGINHAAGFGIYGSSSSGYAVYGTSTSNYGVYGQVSNGTAGVAGANNGSGYGVSGASHSGYGIYGKSTTSYAGYFQGDVFITGHLNAHGVNLASAPHPTDPALEIQLGSLHGPESGTYFRGSARIVNGFATIPIPDSFRMVTSAQGLTVQVTPMGAPAVLYCVKKDLEKVVIQGNADVDFDYTINGIWKGSETFHSIVKNEDFVPTSASDDDFTRHRDAQTISALKAAGILNTDGSINRETARRLGWDQRESWKRADAAKQ